MRELIERLEEATGPSMAVLGALVSNDPEPTLLKRKTGDALVKDGLAKLDEYRDKKGGYYLPTDAAKRKVRKR